MAKAATPPWRLFVLFCCCVYSRTHAYKVPKIHSDSPELPFNGGLHAWIPQQKTQHSSTVFQVPSLPLHQSTVHRSHTGQALTGTSAEEPVSETNGNEREPQRRRDHRTLGTMMDLFCFPKPKLASMGGVGPALLPRGQCCMLQLQRALRKLQEQQGFEEVRTGSLAQAYLWRRSGHMEHFADSMFEIADFKAAQKTDASGETVESEEQQEKPEQNGLPTDTSGDNGTSYLLKPMSCPLHLSLFFERSVRSGSDAPLRISEFGHVYRREVPSALSGLMRLREFTQPKAHHPEILRAPITSLAQSGVSGDLGFFTRSVVRMRLVFESHRPTSSQGSEQEWAHAEGLLRTALEELNIPCKVAAGEGAFYGPKIDIHVPNVERRLWQIGTLQVDMFSPKAFALEPVPSTEDRLCLLHRAMCGSLERFLCLVLENSDGHLKPWLAPTQVAILSVGEGQASAADALGRRLRRSNVRVSIDTRPIHISRKLKLYLKYRVPEIWLMGTTDQERNTVTVRRPRGEQQVVPVERALAAARRRAKLPF
ncbi:threonyl-tRNA synthetase, putative [Eimeria tenella]|uniref:threonine--tRNA ligase n=1 Tax=Eimeria tenella TaxID=5802 RepID=U6KMA7_EIMTE|nr:threonyl-tRNA synthetase, putative [Eimeria tenella]CDJ37397.1 threonyl-tRNA synthetase, putative [Eimeria tenella]|eukprot:XP_013228235.1 threonyl-tRNA synthetase, putative [Eimeria tenella]